MNSKRSSPGVSRVMMIVGAACLIGGIALAATGASTVGIVLVVVGAVLMLVSWAVLIQGVRRWKKDIGRLQAEQQERIDRVMRDPWQAGDDARRGQSQRD